MRVKLVDVAKKSGVSASTVSQYLNGRYKYMSEATKSKIEKVIKELKYEPNIIARGLKIKQTNTIGIIVSNIQSPFFVQAVRGIEDYCLKKGYNVILCNTDNNPEKEVEYMKMLRNKQVDGILISYSSANKDFLEKFIKTETPVVVFNKDVSGLEVSTVISENRNGTYKAINHFLNIGFKDIGIISSDLKDIPCRLKRVEGYKDALRDNSIEYDEGKVFFFDETMDFVLQIEKLFSEKRMPRAIFSFNYKMTISFLKFCKKNNLKIPEDVAVIGFDEIPYAELFVVPVTVVKEKDYEIGNRATEILFEYIENKIEKNTVIKKDFPCELIIRESCGSKL